MVFSHQLSARRVLTSQHWHKLDGQPLLKDRSCSAEPERDCLDSLHIYDGNAHGVLRQLYTLILPVVRIEAKRLLLGSAVLVLATRTSTVSLLAPDLPTARTTR